MSEKLKISPGELRASARAADIVAKDLQKPLTKALGDIADAASALQHWSVGSRLKSTGEGWGVSLGTLRGRLSEHANGLRLVADGHDVNEQDVRSQFKGW